MAFNLAKTLRRAKARLDAIRPGPNGLPNTIPAWTTIGISFLQLLFLTVLTGLTGKPLDQNNECQLNLSPKSGRVCDFVYVSYGFIFLFIVYIGVVTYLTLRKRSPGPIQNATTISTALFAWFWYVVVAMTLLKRGNQASDAGQPYESARKGVIALAWIVTSLFLVVSISATVDIIINWIPTEEPDLGHTFIEARDDTRGTVYARALEKNSVRPAHNDSSRHGD